ncbi:MAG: co-chaperone GroES [Lactobacillales bacterium]|nr:co-chaperone GroES [Lactobacillales bacterium]
MLKPLGERIVLKKKKAEKSVGGIILASQGADAAGLAEVIAVGPGARTLNGELVAPSVKSGDIVLVEEFAGVVVKHDGEEFLVVREGEIIAVVD